MLTITIHNIKFKLIRAMNGQSKINLKFIIIGDPTVGKTTLRRRYIGDGFQANYLPTVGADFSYKGLEVDGKDVLFAIWDIAGQSKFHNLHKQYFLGSAGAMIVFDITNPSSFYNITKWIDKLLGMGSFSNIPILIIGNKIDLESEVTGFISENMQNNEILGLRAKYPNLFDISSCRTSAKTGINIDKSFQDFTKLIYKYFKTKQQETAKISITPDKIQSIIPACYIMAFDEVFGPKIIVRIPVFGHEDGYSEIEQHSAVKLFTSFDSGTAEDTIIEIGLTPWLDPSGLLYYISFPIDNPSARGNIAFYLIGVIFQHKLKQVVGNKSNLIDGCLHNTMNLFAEFLYSNSIDFVTQKRSNEIHSNLIPLNNIMENLRNDIFEIIKDDL